MFSNPEEEKLFLLKQEELIVDAELSDVQKEMDKLRAQIDALRVKERDSQVRKATVRTAISDQSRLILRLAEEARVILELKGEDDFIQEVVAEIVKLTEDFPSFKKARHYQYDDIIATVVAYKKNLTGMLNCNDMGAGKTAETVITLYIFTKMYKAEFGREPNILWLTKLSLLKSTPNEIRRWWPGAVIFKSPSGNLSAREFALEMYEMVGGIYMANYEFTRTTPKCKDVRWDFVVIDEVHKLKGGANSNGPTAIWESCRDIAVKARFNIMLTGTPMVNKPEEMWAYLHIFNQERFPDMKKFRRDFCDYKNIAGTIQLAVDPMKILNNALKGQMIRRSRSEFGIELPEHSYEVIELQMGDKQLDIYEQMRKRFFVWLDDNSDQTLSATAIIAQLTRLRQINLLPSSIAVDYAVTDSTGAPVIVGDEVMIVKKAVDCNESIKIDEAMDRIEMVTSLPSQVDDSITEQIVIFCTFNEPMREIQRRCDALGIKCEVVSGQSTSREKNRDLEAEFQRGEIQVLCINSAVGEGLNIQKNPSSWIGGTSYGIILDKWWNSSRQEQCIGRYHRQGSVIPCTTWVFENENSVDAYINAIIAEKSEGISSIMDSEVVRPKGNWKEYLEGLI